MRAVETLTVSGTLSGARDAVDAFERFGSTHDVPPGATWRFLLALDEILSNIVRYGLRDRDGDIHLTFATDADAVSIEIADHADPFNPLLTPAPDILSPLNQRQPGGLGIALVRQLMTETRYEWRDDQNHFFMAWRPDADR